MRRIQLAHRLAGDAGLLQIVLKTLHVAVGGVADCLFHMDHQDQVRPALQVEPQVDVIGQRLLQRGRGQSAGDAQKAIAEHNQTRYDGRRLDLQILIHCFLYSNSARRPGPPYPLSLVP